MSTKVDRTGWVFAVRQVVQGPIDHEYETPRCFASATLWISFGIGKDVELMMTTHWLDGESELDVKARACRLWGEKFRRMSDALDEQGQFYAALAAKEGWGA